MSAALQEIMFKSEVLAIIPARGGSKSIPRKNIKKLSGIPLLQYTSTAALNSKFTSRVVLSTEDREISEYGIKIGLDVPFLRPMSLAHDSSPSLPVFKFTLAELKKRQGYVPDLVIVLQPTSPFRNSLHIDEAIQRIIEADADSLVSVVKIPHNMSPFSAMKLEANGCITSVMSMDESQNQRQVKPIYFARNGAAIYITKPKVILEQNTLFGPNTIGYEMNKLDSIDIDDEEDWILAESLINWRK